MSEIVGAELQVDRLISADPGNGIIAVLNADATVANIVSRNQTSGDVTWSAPVGSDGGGARRHLYDRPIVSTSTAQFTTVTATTGIVSGTGSFSGMVALTKITTPQVDNTGALITIASGATANIAISAIDCHMWISDKNVSAESALIAVAANLGTAIIWQSGDKYTTTHDTASKINVSYSAGNLRIQNNQASSANFAVTTTQR